MHTMKKFIFLILTFFLWTPLQTHALELAVEIEPIITRSTEAVQKERVFIFDADDYCVVEHPEIPGIPLEPLTCEWDFGDGTTANGEEVVHAYAESGTYPVTLTLTQGEGEEQRQEVATISIFVYEKLILF